MKTNKQKNKWKPNLKIEAPNFHENQIILVQNKINVYFQFSFICRALLTILYSCFG